MSELTQQNAVNLRILHKFLSDNYDMVDKHLDMSQFCNNALRPVGAAIRIQDEDFRSNQCGTTLCLAGWTAGIPEFKQVVDRGDSYSVTLDNLFGTRATSVFSYLFSEDWEDDLDAGLKRIDRLCTAIEQEDTEFLNYLMQHCDELMLVHCDEEYEDIDGKDFDTLEDALEYFPLYNTPDWY